MLQLRYMSLDIPFFGFIYSGAIVDACHYVCFRVDVIWMYSILHITQSKYTVWNSNERVGIESYGMVLLGLGVHHLRCVHLKFLSFFRKCSSRVRF